MNIKIIHRTYEKEKYYEIDTDKNYFKVNGKTKDADIETVAFISGALISTWPEHLEKENVYDGNECKILLKDEGEKRSCTFINKMPENFSQLIDCLEDTESKQNI